MFRRATMLRRATSSSLHRAMSTQPLTEGWAAKTLMQSKEPLLFTPGPLTTSAAVKQAMLVDIGSRDKLFLKAMSQVRHGLLRAAGVSQSEGYECVIVQGAGTMGVESVIGSVA